MNNASVLSIKDKIGYGLGDMASALVWQTATLFLAYFYTDVFGLPAAVMGTLFLAVRAVDAFADPCIGALVDRTQTRHGKFRPWLLWFAVPFGISCLLTFYVPNLSLNGKIIYASLTYCLLCLVYSAINVPYCAMPGALTQDPRERHSIQSWRFALSFIGGLVVTVIALPLVDWLGHGDSRHGYFYAMSLMGLLGVILFFCCFSMTRERYRTDQPKGHSMLGDLKSLWHNSQWRIVFVFNILLLIAVVTRGSATIYYVKYVLLKPALVFPFIVSGMIAALFGALVGWVLGLVNYLPNQGAQSAHVTNTIAALFTIIPSLLFIAMAMLLFAYRLNSRYVRDIAEQLAARHKQNPSPKAPDTAIAHV
ncbi:glycoside-pentoside-hexuronide (GPH):cation symporter [Martelella alba]|uniref:MFS transporter n=1 Tax=Martelella alba TaxID=2590451 RepID=A0ABY2SP66_9HYPH|nr:glycoside-pentoside-hexuronide (GPH):cation symporter [Martelella alba]TKI06353.1 MFS transporter [Martelella alba]